MKIKNRFSINQSGFLYLLLGLYLILPRRLEVAGVYSYRLFLPLLFVLILFLTSGKLKIVPHITTVFYIVTIIICNVVHLNFINLVWNLLELFIIVLCLPIVLKTKKRYIQVIDMIIYLSGILAVLGILETFTGFNVFDVISGNYVELVGANSLRFGLYRSRGFLTTSINNALFLGMAATLTAYRITFTDKFQKKKYMIIYVIILLNLISTISRGVIICFGITQLLVWWKAGVLKNPKRIIKIFLMVLIVLMCLQIIGVPVFKTISNIYYMIAVIFNSNLQSNVASNFGGNITGIGNRLELFQWIYEKVRNNLLFGMGYNNHFSIIINGNYLKTSIENTFLSYLYYNGFVGLAGLIIFLLGNLYRAFKWGKRLLSFEKKLSYDCMMLFLMLGYYASLFTVNAVDDLRLFYVLIALMVSRHKIFEFTGRKYHAK